MSTTSFDSVLGFTAGQFAVPTGVTNALLIDGGVIPGCNSMQLKYFSGGTLQIIGVAAGVTYTGAQLVAAGVTLGGYIVGATEVLAIGGPARFYLAATGATTIVQFLFGKSQGN